MISEHDERKGLVRVYWQDIRERVHAVNPEFAQYVDVIDPGKELPLFLAYYDYGVPLGGVQAGNTWMLPKMDGTYIGMNDPFFPSDVAKELGYAAHTSPLTMVLEKEIEYFVDFKARQLTVPVRMYTPGSLFSFSRILGGMQAESLPPSIENSFISATSGARSAFMLPTMGVVSQYTRLKRALNLRHPKPTSLYEHGLIFKAILQSRITQSDWKACVLYFPESWVTRIRSSTESPWKDLRLYLHESFWRALGHERVSHLYQGVIFSSIQKDRNLKPSPYLADVARHLLIVPLGMLPGYVPACNDDALPLAELQAAFLEYYGIKYIPTIMHPKRVHFRDTPSENVYFSLQYPSMLISSPKARGSATALYELRELNHIMNVYMEELSHNPTYANTMLGDIANNVSFQYFHNDTDPHDLVNLSGELIEQDLRFRFLSRGLPKKGLQFAHDGKFLRGSIAIKNKSPAIKEAS